MSACVKWRRGDGGGGGVGSNGSNNGAQVVMSQRHADCLLGNLRGPKRGVCVTRVAGEGRVWGTAKSKARSAQQDASKAE
jgi:hypothetical protein